MDRGTLERSDELTTEERETLQRALELGYFDDPKAASLTEVAEDLGKRDVEVSRLIRGGTRAVLRGTDVLATPPVTIVTDGSETPRRLDGIFDTLSHPYRRRILLLVSDHNPRDEDEFSVDDLATEDDDLKLLTEELYQLHLPNGRCGVHRVERGHAHDSPRAELREHRPAAPVDARTSGRTSQRVALREKAFFDGDTRSRGDSTPSKDDAGAGAGLRIAICTILLSLDDAPLPSLEPVSSTAIDAERRV